MLAPLLLSLGVAFAAPQPAWQQRLAVLQQEAAAVPAQEPTARQLADKAWGRRRLAEMSALDQKVRRFWIETQREADTEGQGAEFKESMNVLISGVDRRHTAELKRLLAVYDWFTIDEFGEEADQNAWLLVQHADLDHAFQKEILSRLERLSASGRTSKRNYAYLYDRVAVAEGRPQRYGTQGDCKDGRWTPLASEDPALLDDRRASTGLEPISQHQASFSSCP